MHLLSLASRLTALTLIAQVAHAQVEVIWSSVLLTTFGDRVPLLSPNLSVLTPLGAQQMFNAGQYFRQRYITDARGRTTIPGISYNSSDSFQTIPKTLSDLHVQQSAQAFMGGLYPPSSSTNDATSAMAQLANGSIINAPLEGQQYFGMDSYQPSDPYYVLLAGSTQCPMYDEEVRSTYTSQSGYQSTKITNQARYNAINDAAFGDALKSRDVGYGSSYAVWDYLNYMRLHNATIAKDTSADDLRFTKNMADNFAEITLGQTNDQLLSLPGRAISTMILSGLESNALTNGTQFNINMLFTSWEPLLSLIYLLGILDTDSDMHGIPNVGSTLVFELFSDAEPLSGAIGGFTPTYPLTTDDLFVRVGYRNGTIDGSNSTLAVQTMSKVTSNNTQAVTLSQFITALEGWSVNRVGDWCDLCGNSALAFCTGLSSASMSPGTITIVSGGAQSKGPSPAVSGVIGAVVMLAVTGLMALALMLLGGFRLRRDRPSVAAGKAGLIIHKRRQSSMGGFKGAEKMASDVDLPKGGALVGASVAPVHNRTGSWELKEGGLQRPERDSQNTVFGEPGPEISETAGISFSKHDDEELEGMAPVKIRESI